MAQCIVEGRVKLEATAVGHGVTAHTPNISDFIAAARAAHVDFGYGDYDLRITAVPRSDDGADELMKGLDSDDDDEEEDEKVADGLMGLTPTAAIDSLADTLSIFGFDRPEGGTFRFHRPHPVELEARYGSFLAALLPDAGEPIVEVFRYYLYDGNDCHARFATREYAFSFFYQTS
jgi:hypothetical protein